MVSIVDSQFEPFTLVVGSNPNVSIRLKVITKATPRMVVAHLKFLNAVKNATLSIISIV